MTLPAEFKIGDLITASDNTRIFESNSDWSKFEYIKQYTYAIVFIVTKNVTGSGRLWLKILVSMSDGHTKVGWIDSPRCWNKVHEFVM